MYAFPLGQGQGAYKVEALTQLQLLALTTEEFMKIHRIEQWETDEEVRLAKKERAREARKATAVTVSETIAPRVLVK